MPIAFKSKLSSLIANATFLDKTIDDIKKGKLTLFKNLIGDAETVDDVQNFLNEISDTQGTTEGDANRKVYLTNHYITDGESQKGCIESLDAQVEVNATDILTNAQNILINTKFVHLHQVLTAGAQLTLDLNSMNQVFRVSGDGVAVTLNALLFTNHPKDGMMITIEGHDDVFSVRVNLNDSQFGQAQFGDVILKKYFSITYEYNGELERFIERWRKTQ